MSDFILSSLRGGMNDTDPPSSLPDDQCVLAQNAEFNRSTCGERRRGAEEIDLSDSGAPADADRILMLHRHLPTEDETDSELFAFAMFDTAVAVTMYRRTTAWSVVTLGDGHGAVPAITDPAHYQMNAQTLHGKLFLARKTDKDRLHVWDGTSLRAAGLAEPAAPTAADTGSGSLSGTRYYRVRYTVQSGGTTLLRSEPSDTLTFSPSGSGTGVVVTKPAAITEGETHWELEASLDNANFYRIATTAVATTTVTDSTAFTTSYSAFTLSEDIGDYTTIWSAKYLAADEDRLLFAGSFMDDALASRFGWSPVFKDPGVGNDERIPLDTDNFLDLDGYEGGPITGMSTAINGYTYVFKLGHIYKAVRTGQRSKAYEAFAITKERGALPNSIVAGVDASGNPVLFFLDPRVGPCVLGAGGQVLQMCGADILTTWSRVNLDAEKLVCRALYYPGARQVHWWVAVDGSDTPNLRLVLQTNELRSGPDGARRGWAVWDGPSAEALATCLYADNIDTDDPRSRVLVPFIGRDGDGLIWRTDTGDDDNGTAYAARIRTKPYTPTSILHKFGVMVGAVLAKAAASVTMQVKLVRDFGLGFKTTTIDLTPTAAAEDQVVRVIDNLSLGEMSTVQIDLLDSATPTGRWEVNQVALKERAEQTG